MFSLMTGVMGLGEPQSEMSDRDLRVDTGPMGFPTEKREEDLVQLVFPTCNPTRTSYT